MSRESIQNSMTLATRVYANNPSDFDACISCLRALRGMVITAAEPVFKVEKVNCGCLSGFFTNRKLDKAFRHTNKKFKEIATLEAQENMNEAHRKEPRIISINFNITNNNEVFTIQFVDQEKLTLSSIDDSEILRTGRALFEKKMNVLRPYLSAAGGLSIRGAR